MGRLVAVLLVIASLPISTAGAEPFAGQVDRAGIQTRVIGADGREWLVRLKVEEVTPLGGTTTLTASIAIDTCAENRCTGKAFALLLDPSEFTLESDASRAELSTRVLGRPLDLVWECSEGCTTGHSIAIQVGGSISDSTYQDMIFEGDLFGISCTGLGAVEKMMIVDPAGSPSSRPPRPPKALPRGFIDGPRKARCR